MHPSDMSTSSQQPGMNGIGARILRVCLFTCAFPLIFGGIGLWFLAQTNPTQALILAGLLLAGVAGSMALVLRQIQRMTQPLTALVAEAQRLARGEQTNAQQFVARHADKDEIGQLVQAFGQMAQNLSEQVEVIRHLADGELQPIDALVARYGTDEHQGILARALNKIIHRQIEYVEIADHIANGEIVDMIPMLKRYEGRPEAGQLAKALGRMTDSISDMVQSALHLADGELIPIDALEQRYAGNEKAGILIKALNKIIHRQMEYVKIAQRVGDGDLVDMSEIIARYEGRPNAGVIAKALYKMIESLRTLVTRITETASELAMASGQIAETANQTGHATEQVTQTIQQVAVGVQDQAAQLTAIAGEMQTLKEMGDVGAQASIDTGRIARTSGELITNTLTSMEMVRRNVGDGAQQVRRLSEQSHQISAITTSIADIADQTNLLALNAAIEAARAGEHGRGFSVVADEVRKLAERASVATQEIAKIISEVQEQVQTTLKTMESGVSNVETVTAQSRSAEEAFQQILGAMDDAITRSKVSAESTDRIATSVGNVASVSEENSAGAEEVSAAAEEMAAQIEETIAATQQLHDLTRNLRSAVEVFQTNAEPDAGLIPRRRADDWGEAKAEPHMELRTSKARKGRAA